MLGDGSAFWIGHRSQREILSNWPMCGYPRLVAQSEAFFHRWGTLAVFFARFVPPIRAFVPVTAGALGMPSVALLRRQCSGDPGMGARPCAAGRAGDPALHDYAGIPHHHGIGKLAWILAVVAGAVIVALASWTIRRRRAASAKEPTVEQIRGISGSIQPPILMAC